MPDLLNGKLFAPEDVAVLQEIILHRRDVRGARFTDRLPPEQEIDQILTAALHAPSVGFSQPWEFVLITDKHIRQQVKDSFEVTNNAAKADFKERQQEYTRMKLEGILEAPLNIAVFYRPPAGAVLGQTSMAETGVYSVVCAVQNMWLMARALNIGMGWVSILDAEKVCRILNAPAGRLLVAYLCLGYTDGFYARPELEILQWDKRRDREEAIRYQRYGEQPDGSAATDDPATRTRSI